MHGVEDGLLLREHAHRVSNDMAVAAAALRLADRRVGGDPEIGSSIARLDAAARVQRLLCVRPSGSLVDLTAAVAELCAAMSLARPGPGGEIRVSGPILMVGDDAARLMAMCVHELVGNALRHAGPQGGRARVEVTDDGDMTTVAVLDGAGEREWARAGGQGTGIVDQLAARLGGAVVRSVASSGGSVVVAVPCLAKKPVISPGGPVAVPTLEAA